MIPRVAVESCIVEASAGTGKTRELVAQIVRAIASGVAVERIVAVTFTHAAAGEMKLRVRQELDRARAQSPSPAESARLSLALQTLDRAFIGTIHAFCALLLRQRPVEACIDPGFQELSQPEALSVFSSVFRAWIEQRLASPSPVLRRALSRLASRDDSEEREPLESLRHAAWCLSEWRDHPTAWEKREFDITSSVAALVDAARGVVAMRYRCTRPSDELFRKLQPVADLIERVDRSSSVGATDIDSLESELLRLPWLVRWLPRGKMPFAPGLSRDAMVDAWERFADLIEEFRKSADADLAASLRDELWDVVRQYGMAKQRAGQLDFLDLLIFARQLLRNDSARAYFQSQYDRLFIDEFQDTDPLQAEILLLLTADDPEQRDWRKVRPATSKLFVVGDPKQSIYRFRRADARLYRSIQKSLLAGGVGEHKLSVSHRSIAPLQDFVNAAFASAIPDYLPLTGGPSAPHDQPSVIALPMPHPYGSRNVSKVEINRCSPVAVAAFIDWLISQSGWRVRDPGTGDWIPVRADHICVLFRRFTNMGTDLTQEYVRCLEARAIQHVLVGSKSFHQREEVGTIRTLLRAVEWPDDELSVFAVLRGALFSISDGTLLKFRHEHHRFHPSVDLPEDLDPEFEPVRDALSLLRELHRSRNYVPIADTVSTAIEHTRAHAAFAFRKGGERVLANVYRLADLARTFEITGATSFRSFIDFLDAEAKSIEAPETPVLEQQAAGVKLMTVHKAKGLEFPVVILADLTARIAGSGSADRHIDPERDLCAQRLMGCAPWELLDHCAEEDKEDLAEAHRVAYVAATRARDLLVVSTVGEQQIEDSWLTPVYDAVYPPADHWRNSSPAVGCPPFGNTTVLNRPPENREETSVKPGLHSAKVGGHGVVWFDPAVLDIADTKDQGLDRFELLQGTPEQTQAGLDAYESWRVERAAANSAGSQTRWNISRIIDLPDIQEAAHVPVEVVNTTGDMLRPGGRRFGRLVHAVLQLTADPEQVGRIAQSQGRKWRCPPEEVEAATLAARAVLSHHLLRSASNHKTFRELPVALTLKDGTLAEGNIDLAWFDGETWIVVDYKTDSANQGRYKRQLQVYGLALERATSRPVRCYLVEA